MRAANTISDKTNKSVLKSYFSEIIPKLIDYYGIIFVEKNSQYKLLSKMCILKDKQFYFKQQRLQRKNSLLAKSECGWHV